MIEITLQLESVISLWISGSYDKRRGQICLQHSLCNDPVAITITMLWKFYKMVTREAVSGPNLLFPSYFSLPIQVMGYYSSRASPGVIILICRTKKAINLSSRQTLDDSRVLRIPGFDYKVLINRIASGTFSKDGYTSTILVVITLRH